MKISDGKIINIADRLIQEEKIIWTIDIKAGTNERMTYIQSPADGQIMVFIFTYSFDRIQEMRKKALSELKKGVLNYAENY